MTLSLLTLALLIGTPNPAQGVNLTKVDRTVRKEPAYRGKPSYALLVFGPRAEHKVWLVLDGEGTLYVDRDGDGGLAGPGKAVAAGAPKLADHYREWSFDAGDLAPAGAAARHTGLSVSCFQDGGRPACQVVRVKVGGALPQWAGWGPLFKASPREAPVIHLGAPVVARPVRYTALQVKQGSAELHFCLGTPGLGEHAFAYVAIEAVPEAVRPVVEIAWPTAGGTTAARGELRERCWYYEFHGLVQAPEEAAGGKAVVSVTFPGWDGVTIAKGSFEMSVIPAKKWLAPYPWDSPFSPARRRGKVVRRYGNVFDTPSGWSRTAPVLVGEHAGHPLPRQCRVGRLLRQPPLPQVRELRTIDSYFNTAADGSYAVGETLDDLPSVLEMLPAPVPGRQYTLLFRDVPANEEPLEVPGATPLGYDLSDETHTSSLTNCGTWLGDLEPIAARVNEYGLLGLEDAKLAQRLLPQAWPEDPHGRVTVWALYELSKAR